MQSTLQSMVASFIHKVNGHDQWSSQSIVAILTKLSTLSLPDTAKEEIQAAMANIVQGGQQQVSTNDHSFQQLSPYLSKNDWAELHSPMGKGAGGMHIIAKRLRAMGLPTCKEDTKKQAIGILVHVAQQEGQKAPSLPMAKQMTEDFGAVFHGLPKRQEIKTTHKFPVVPASMGQDWLQQVYGQDDEPMGIIISAEWARRIVTCLQFLCSL